VKILGRPKYGEALLHVAARAALIPGRALGIGFSALIEYGTLFCQLTISGLCFFCICGSVVLILSIIFIILGLLKAYFFLDIYLFQMLPLHGPFLLHNVALFKQATPQFKQRGTFEMEFHFIC